MRLRLAVPAFLVLVGCASTPPEASGDDPLAAPVQTEASDPSPAAAAQTRAENEPSATPEAPSGLTCGIDGTETGARALFDLTPTAWLPLAQRLLACSPEAIESLALGPPDSSGSSATISTYRRRIANRERVLVLAYDADGIVGVSVGEDVPERLSETVFDLRSVQTREAAGGEPIPSPPGTLVFPATSERPFGVRLVSSPPLLVLSLVRE